MTPTSIRRRTRGTSWPQLLVGVALVLGVTGGAGTLRPADGQELPPLNIPPPPPEVGATLEIIAPIASPACGNVGVLVVAVPALAASAPLPNLAPLFGPLLIVCGATPAPAPGTQLSCYADTVLDGLLREIATAVAGSPLPLDIRLGGPLVEQIAVLQDLVPPIDDAGGLVALASGVLNCHPIGSALTEEPPPTPGGFDGAPTAADSVPPGQPGLSTSNPLPPLASVVTPSGPAAGALAASDADAPLAGLRSVSSVTGIDGGALVGALLILVFAAALWARERTAAGHATSTIDGTDRA